METLPLSLTYQTSLALYWMLLISLNMFLTKKEKTSSSTCSICKRKLPKQLNKLLKQLRKNKAFLQDMGELQRIGLKAQYKVLDQVLKRSPNLDPISLYFRKSCLTYPVKSLYIEWALLTLSISIPERKSIVLFLYSFNFLIRLLWCFFLGSLNVFPIL